MKTIIEMTTEYIAINKFINDLEGQMEEIKVTVYFFGLPVFKHRIFFTVPSE